MYKCNIENNHVLIHCKLPVSIASNINIRQLAVITKRIGATQYQFTTILLRITEQIIYFLILKNNIFNMERQSFEKQII